MNKYEFICKMFDLWDEYTDKKLTHYQVFVRWTYLMAEFEDELNMRWWLNQLPYDFEVLGDWK